MLIYGDESVMYTTEANNKKVCSAKHTKHYIPVSGAVTVFKTLNNI